MSITCREKLRDEHPDKINPNVGGGCTYCPSTYGYLEDPDYCSEGFGGANACNRCWDREIPEEAASEGLIKGLNAVNPEIFQAAEQLAKETKAKADEFLGIKDSGDRTEFETGAVRDMREGKGRCDLMPLEVVSYLLGRGDDRAEAITWNLNLFMKSHNTDFLYHAIYLFSDACWKDKFSMLLEVAKHFEEGAKKYGENNWQKGIPVYCYIDSAIRHYLKWLRGDKDEPHDRAFVWNIMCCIWEVDYHKEDSTCN